ncbi:phage tail protein [Pedobacter sp. AJM]|uniref:phage tail protein n=1 Tax=Pedobacter sp. AJM TaxID=2003629 RepID=UPI000B4AB83C|nr:tail fiber protein [Pedobacter sp. AJM]OWK68725.1 hypothetical protein CBW18_20610 [Pedobacter sp. AJM]
MELYLGTIVLWAGSYSPVSFTLCYGQSLNINSNAALYAVIGSTFGGNGQTTFNLPDFRGRVPLGANAVAPNVQLALGATVGSPSVNVTSAVAGTATATVGSGLTASGNITLTSSQLPSHNHDIPALTVNISIPVNNASTIGNSTGVPTTSNVLGQGFIAAGLGSAPAKIYGPTPSNTTLSPFNATSTAATSGSTGTGAAIPVSLPVTGNFTFPLTGAIASAPNVPVVQPSLGINFLICTQGLFPSRN